MALPLKYWHPLWTTPLSPAMADSSPAEGSVFGRKTQILYIVTFTSSLFNQQSFTSKIDVFCDEQGGAESRGNRARLEERTPVSQKQLFMRPKPHFELNGQCENPLN